MINDAECPSTAPGQGAFARSGEAVSGCEATSASQVEGRGFEPRLQLQIRLFVGSADKTLDEALAAEREAVLRRLRDRQGLRQLIMPLRDVRNDWRFAFSVCRNS